MFQKLFLFALSFIIISACDDAENSCREQSRRSLNVSFYSYRLVKGRNVSRDTLLDSVSLYGIGREDSFLFKNVRGISKFSLPLNQNSDSASFVLSYKKDSLTYIYDTIRVQYKRETTFLSYKCGYYTNFNIDTISNSAKYDSVRILHKSISNERLENYRITIRNRLY